jgi:hypothetical protein
VVGSHSFSIYLAWISVATIVNVASTLYSLGWNGWGIDSQLWTAIALVAGGAIAAIVTVGHRDIAFVLVFVWAFVAIAVRQGNSLLIATTAGGLAIALILLLVFSLLRRQKFPRTIPMTSNVFHNKQKFFDRWAPNYDCLFTTIFYQAVHKRMLEYVELPRSTHVLDLGCGTGRLLHRLATQFPTLQGTGLDLSTEMLRQAQQRNQHGTRLTYRQGNAESMPFAEGEFDAVFNTISFLHYPNPQQVVFPK